MSPPLISKAAARYTGAGGREHCSLCRHFSPRRGGRCARVLGDISPRGWCRLFSREMRGLVADVTSFNGGGGGPSLALDFMTPGTLDPRITFTRASTGTYFNSAGVMQTATTNTPRWDYDPATLQLRGMLIEEARTNVVLNSADASNASWIKANATVAAPVVTGNQTIAPDGTTTAARAVFPAVPAAPNYSALQPAGPVMTAAIYTFSVWLKGSVGGEQIYLYTTRDTTLYYQTRVTLTTSWQRFSLTTGTLSAANWFFVIGCDRRDTGQTAIAAQTIYVWGAQLELGGFATSYIPTSTVAVTRAAETASVPPAPWLVPATGTIATDFMLANRTTPDQTLFDMAGSTATVRHRVAGGSGWVIRATIGAVGFNTANAVASQNIVAKAALAWGGTTGASALNGGTVATATISTDATGATAMTLGSAAGAGYLNGWLRQTRYWNRALSSVELQTVTT